MKRITSLLTLLSFVLLNSQTLINNTINGLNNGDDFGSSIALSANGNILAVGAKSNSDNGGNSGHVRVFENIDNVWTQIGASIVGEDGFGQSGTSLDLSSNGEIIIIGAPLNSDVSFFTGHARVLGNINGVWTQIGADIDSDEPGDRLGTSVSISCDGSIVAASAIRGNSNNSGYVKIFENINNVWTQIGQNINGESDGDNSGSAISLSCDGNKIAIGAFGNNGVNGSSSGHVRVFENINNIWTQVGQDIDGELAGDQSGSSLSLSCDGNTVAIGAPENGVAGTSSGQVRIYENISNVWTQVGQDIDGEGFIDNSGFSVSLSCDGNIVSVGAINNNPNSDGNAGHVRVYQNISNSWVQVGQDIDGLEGQDTFGYSVAMSSDGSIVASGAIEMLNSPSNDPSNGYVRVFNLSSLLSNFNFLLSEINLFPNPTNNIINIKGLRQSTNYSIYNLLGNRISKGQVSDNRVIDIGDFTSGIYLLDLGNGNVKRIIKN